MELLTLAVTHRENVERGLWLVVRATLDAGVPVEEVADHVGVSVPTLYRRLREQNLTYGRGRVHNE